MTREQKILLAGSNLWYLGEGMLGPLFAVFTQKIGGSILDLSWAWSLYLIVTGLLIAIVGHFSDKTWFDKTKVMVLGYALNALCTFGYLFVTNTTGVLFLEVCLGIAAALSSPTWSSLFSQHEDEAQSGTAWGLAHGQAQLMSGVAVLIGGLLVQRFSFSALFLCMGIIQVIATILQARLLTDRLILRPSYNWLWSGVSRHDHKSEIGLSS